MPPPAQPISPERSAAKQPGDPQPQPPSQMSPHDPSMHEVHSEQGAAAAVPLNAGSDSVQEMPRHPVAVRMTQTASAAIAAFIARFLSGEGINSVNGLSNPAAAHGDRVRLR